MFRRLSLIALAGCAVAALQPAPAAAPRFVVPAGFAVEEVWSPEQSGSIREYLEFDPMAYQGSAEKGRQLYERAFCANCHRVGTLGQDAGPDLTDVGRRFKRMDILEAILHPSKTISEQWAAIEFVTSNKQSVVGVVVSETPDAYQVRTVAGQSVRLPKKDIASRTTATVSAMPEGLLNGLSLSEIRDLLTFLEKGE